MTSISRNFKIHIRKLKMNLVKFWRPIQFYDIGGDFHDRERITRNTK